MFISAIIIIISIWIKRFKPNSSWCVSKKILFLKKTERKKKTKKNPLLYLEATYSPDFKHIRKKKIRWVTTTFIWISLRSAWKTSSCLVSHLLKFTFCHLSLSLSLSHTHTHTHHTLIYAYKMERFNFFV